jgi:glycosyltransferase involved in cell wall biosynthesis
MDKRTRMKVVHIYRKKKPGFHSIEELFHNIAAELDKKVEIVEYVVGSRLDLIKDAVNLRRLHADVYHITGDVHYFAMVLPRKKTVLTIHDIGYFINSLSGIKGIIYKWLWLVMPISYAMRVTTISDYTLASIVDELKITKNITVIQNCRPHVFRHIPKEFNQTTPILLQVGTHERKNLLRVIDAIKGTPCKLHIIGNLSPGVVDKLKDSGVQYVNFVDIGYEAVFEQYVTADMVCFVSLFEGFGMPILEANAVGRPIITSNHEPMRSIAGQSALLVDSTNTVEIHEAVMRIIEDREFRESLVLNGLCNAKRFSPAVIAEQYLKIYRDVTAYA